MTFPAKAVVIGASAGALDALSKVLVPLPSGFPLPVMVVVHIPADKKSVLADLMDAKCNMQVKEAEDKEAVKPDTIYIAPPDYHLQVEEEKILSLSSDEEVLFSRPSIDVLFETAADAYGAGLIGILLTGANTDGSNGLKRINDAGGKILVQDPLSAHAPEMPRAGLEACPDAKILSLDDIAQYLIKAGRP